MKIAQNEHIEDIAHFEMAVGPNLIAKGMIVKGEIVMASLFVVLPEYGLVVSDPIGLWTAY